MALETCFIGETIQYHSPIRLNKTQVIQSFYWQDTEHGAWLMHHLFRLAGGVDHNAGRLIPYGDLIAQLCGQVMISDPFLL